MLIQISNNGKELKYTNYWDMDHAKQGFFYLSWNAGAARLLVPASQESQIEEMSSAKYVIISKGKLSGKDALELMFEDDSDAPFCLYLDQAQTDRNLPAKDQGSGFDFCVWTQEGKKATIT